MNKEVSVIIAYELNLGWEEAGEYSLGREVKKEDSKGSLESESRKRVVLTERK